MDLLITGSSGFLGRRAASHFHSLGCNILTPSHTQLDITDGNAVHRWFQQHSPQAVLHCAAVSDTGKCQKAPESTALVNVTGSIHLAQACSEYGAKFIFCSSDQVYHASAQTGPHRESEVLSPVSAYARQKLLAEQQCQILCCDTVCLRLSWMYSGRISPEDHGHLLTTLRNALQDETLPLTWPIYDRRGITDVDSVVRHLPAALKLPAGVYNFGSSNDMDTYHTIQSVLEELNLREALDRLMPNRQAFADFPRDIRMDGSLAASHGITFESTRSGLCRALAAIL